MDLPPFPFPHPLGAADEGAGFLAMPSPAIGPVRFGLSRVGRRALGPDPLFPSIYAGVAGLVGGYLASFFARAVVAVPYGSRTAVALALAVAGAVLGAAATWGVYASVREAGDGAEFLSNALRPKSHRGDNLFLGARGLQILRAGGGDPATVIAFDADALVAHGRTRVKTIGNGRETVLDRERFTWVGGDGAVLFELRHVSLPDGIAPGRSADVAVGLAAAAASVREAGDGAEIDAAASVREAGDGAEIDAAAFTAAQLRRFQEALRSGRTLRIPLLAYTTGPTDLDAPLQPEGLGSFIAVAPTGVEVVRGGQLQLRALAGQLQCFVDGGQVDLRAPTGTWTFPAELLPGADLLTRLFPARG